MLDLKIKKSKKKSAGVTPKTLRSQLKLGLRMVSRLAAFGAGVAKKDWEGHELFVEGDAATYAGGVYILAHMVPSASGTDFELARTLLIGVGATDEPSKNYIKAFVQILAETKTAEPEVEEDDEEDEDEDEDSVGTIG